MAKKNIIRKLDPCYTRATLSRLTDSNRTKKSPHNKKKLSQADMTEECFCQALAALNSKLDDAEALHESKWGRVVGANPELKADLKMRLFWAKSKVVKSILTANKKMIAYIEKKYKKEIRYSKADKYILHESPQWMMHDEEIVEALEKYPFTIPILNHLWNQNRFARGEELKKMCFLTKRVTGSKKYITEKKKEYEYATFVTNAEFYKIMSEKMRCSKNYLQKYLMAFDKIGIIQKLGSVGRNGTLYANGYYVPYGNLIRKETFLKNTREFKKALRSFNPLAVQNKRLLRRQ